MDKNLDKNKIINKFSINMAVEPFNFEVSNDANLEVMEKIQNKVNNHPLHTRMKVRICYKGRNRNGSFIDELVEAQLVETLPNTPIVGEYWETVDDFGTHGTNLRSNETGELELKRTTIPFGVVPSDTEIWYELSTDKDGVERNYICCEVVLWDKRYPELDGLIKAGRPQSMELDPSTVEGEWIEMDDDFVFKYSKAYLSALCILGQEIEPCFEGAAFLTFSNTGSWADFRKECQEMFNDIKAGCKFEEEKTLGKVSNFELSKDNENNDVEPKLYESMMIFTTGLNISNKGGKFKMGEIKLKFGTTNDIRETIYKAINAFSAENEIYDFKFVVTEVKGNVATVFSYEDNTYYNIKFTASGNEIKTEAPVAINATFQSKDEADKAHEAVNNYNNLKADNTKLQKEIGELKGKMKDYQLTQDEYTTLKTNSDSFAEISEEYNVLKEYRLSKERTAKQEIIEKFAKLGEGDLKVFKETIDKFTADQLEKELGYLAFKKGVSLTEKEENPKPVYSFNNVDGQKPAASGMPGWFSLVSKRENELNNFGNEE